MWAALLSGLLTILGFPFALYTPNLVPDALSSVTAWIALVPLTVSLWNQPPGVCFRRAFLYGAIANFGILFWILIAIGKYGNLSFFATTLILTAVIIFLAMYPALTFWSMARFRKYAPPWLLGSILFTLMEWTRSYVPVGGFPWATPAYSLRSLHVLIQNLDLVGVSGLNFIIFLTNFWLADVWVAWRRRTPIPRRAGSLLLLLLLSAFLYGVHRIQTLQQISSEMKTPPIRAALVQANVAQDQKWNPDHRFRIFGTYERFTALASRENPDLIIWPEAALPLTISDQTLALPFLTPSLSKSELLFGIPTWTPRGEERAYKNSAFLLGSNGRVRYRYDKQHLVPFGEYVPWEDHLPMRSIVPSVAGSFVAGTSPSPAHLKGKPFGVLICYEVLFPKLSVDLVQKGAQFLINITNDAWFDETSGPYQHLIFGRFRAIETRRAIARVANTGITTWFDPMGRMHNATRLFEEDLVWAELEPWTIQTFYVRHPNLVQHILSFLLILTVMGVFRPGNETQRTEEDSVPL